MHWTERRRAKVAIGLALQSRGWTLYGFTEDRSDPMTDYYAPASWDGIAERDGYVVVVDTKSSKRSGGYDTTVSAPAGDCPRCEGSGEEPEGWTLVKAKADPRAFNLDRARRSGAAGIPMMAHVVSPVHFNLADREKCTHCHGRGHLLTTKTVHVDWPKFQPNSGRSLWHVEKDSCILASGIGLGPCADYDRDKAAAAVNRIVTRIEAAIRYPEGSETPGAAAATTTDGVIIRRNLQKAGIEVVFPAKPDETIRSGLKRLGFRWSRRQELWYARYSESLWQRAHKLLGIALDPEPGDDPQNAGPVTGSETPSEKDLPDTVEDIIVEALELDAVIQASDSGFPKEVADRMNELRGAAFRLDPDVDLDAEIRRRRAYDVPKLVRQWQDLTQRLERGHGMRSDSRAAATTKHAHLGQLAQNRDQVQDALRIAVRQAQERGEAIPAAIQAEPDLARILLDEPETEMPETLTRPQAQATLNETMSPGNGAILTRGTNHLDEMLAKTQGRRRPVQVDVILSPRLRDEQEQRQAAERNKSRREPAVLMALRVTAPDNTNVRLAARGWWWNGDLQIWQHHNPDEGWLTIWYLEIGDHVSGVYDALPVEAGEELKAPEHGTGVGLEWPVPLYARQELHQRGWKPFYDEDEVGKTEAWLCPEGQDYSQVIAEVYGLKPDDETPFVRVFTWPRPAADAKPAPPSKIVIRRAEIEWSPDGHLQARDLDSGEIYVPRSPGSSAPHQLALF